MLQKVTNIETLEIDTTENIESKIEINEKNVLDVIFDFSLDNNILIEAINFYYKIYKYNIFEILQRLLSIYNITSSAKVLDYIKHICLHSELDDLSRLETCKQMCLTNPTDDCYSILETLCTIFFNSDSITSTSKVDSTSILLRSEKHRLTALSLFENILDNQKLENKYRYTLIHSLESKWKQLNEKVDVLKPLQYHLYAHFLLNISNDVMYRILSGQVLLRSNQGSDKIYSCILSICNDLSIPYNSRADATDLLLNCEDKTMRETASIIIKNLGTIGSKHSLTIFENAQNAHTSTIFQSAVQTLESLYETVISHLDFEHVVSEISKLSSDPIIARVLNRIELDNATYSKLNVTLKSVISITFSYIIEQDEKEHLLHSLITELKESDGICSTGIFERICNSVSGHSTFLVKISFEEQIKANLFGRLNARITKLPTIPCLHHRMCNCITNSCFSSKVNSQKAKKMSKCGKCAKCLNVDCLHVCGESCDWNTLLMTNALDEMLIPTSMPEKRINFLIIYRFYISEIMEEMHSEFKDYINDDTFYLYFRKAIMQYDCA
jgi:hypothetical protein